MDKTGKTMDWIIKNKKGDVTDIITVGFWLLVIAIGIIAIMFLILQLVPAIKDTAIGEDPNAASALNSLENYGKVAVPSTFLIVFFGLLLGTLISSFFIRTHPIFIPIYILFAMLSIVVAVALGNTWGAFKDVEEFQEILNTNSITNIIDVIMSNIVMVTLIVFILTIIVIFAKPGGGQVQQGGNAPY